LQHVHFATSITIVTVIACHKIDSSWSHIDALLTCKELQCQVKGNSVIPLTCGITLLLANDVNDLQSNLIALNSD